MPRSSLNLSTSAPIENGRKSVNKAIQRKSGNPSAIHRIAAVPRKYSSNAKNQERLTGGADASEIPESDSNTNVSRILSDVPVPNLSEDVALEEVSDTKAEEDIAISKGPCCLCTSQFSRTVGNKKVDEIFECVHQNLQEASKALATLNENFEHDSKLMFVDILGRIQHWSGMVQNKLEICQNDTNMLREQLIARMCEMSDKEHNIESKDEELAKKDQELAELRAQLGRSEVQSIASKIKKEPDHLKSEENYSQFTAKSESAYYEAHFDQPPEQESQQDFDRTELSSMSQKFSGVDGKQLAYADAGVQAALQEIQGGRESELEAEILRLRQDNERVLKERLDYENAIQRALLRGVSSLNVEALKVLRSPPIQYCPPCVPSFTPSTCGTEPIVSCKTAKANAASRNSRSCNTSKHTDRVKNSIKEENACTMKQSCGIHPRCTRQDRKSTASSLLFLLHQSDNTSSCI